MKRVPFWIAESSLRVEEAGLGLRHASLSWTLLGMVASSRLAMNSLRAACWGPAVLPLDAVQGFCLLSRDQARVMNQLVCPEARSVSLTGVTKTNKTLSNVLSLSQSTDT